ncbi:lysophospholipid acyltransferase family protein [Anaeromusa acidaminophila]|uniref:lysophospholipid acyltransferase family protein n=1 Tax=Anaeromusa acidaminophila TaxID=81464 RepID=UPI0003764AC0|nr:lysophospholipid acyltransferase family protein [Anaeromusa acidaminophila]
MSNEWQYHFLKALSRLVCLLPYACVVRLGRALGFLYWYIAPKQRRRGIRQMKERLGLSQDEAVAVMRRLCGNLGQTFLEIMFTPKLDAQRIIQLVEIENRQYLEEAVARGNGVVFLTAHIGNWEWLGAALSMTGFPMTSVIKRQPNDQHTRLLNEYRERVGIEIFARGTAELVGAAKAMKKGKILGFLADQDAGVDGIFLEFFGKPASTPLGPAVFARKFKAPVMPVFIVHKPDYSGHRVLIYPPLEYENSGDEKENLRQLTLKMTQLLEEVIREHPDEWIWFQKRWNTRMDGSCEEA